jgi:extracellular matrix protein 14
MYRLDHVFVLCAVLLAAQVTAVPAGTGITHPHSPPLGPFGPVRFASQTQTQIASSRGPFTWLRDSVIERIWGIDKEKQSLNKPGPRPRPEKSWSRYGSDIVLRIEVHNAEEVEALADAVNILFLDVWDSNENYVDIRLAKEVVSNEQPTDLCYACAYFNRSLHCSDYFHNLSKSRTPYLSKIFRK